MSALAPPLAPPLAPAPLLLVAFGPLSLLAPPLGAPLLPGAGEACTPRLRVMKAARVLEAEPGITMFWRQLTICWSQPQLKYPAAS